MNNIEFWRNEWKEVTSTEELSGLINQIGSSSSFIRNVQIIITNKIVDTYEARSYPDDDFDNNGKIELYEVDVYEIQIIGNDDLGNPMKKIWKALGLCHIGMTPKVQIIITNIKVGQM